MNKTITFALTSNASALGLNWIYNQTYLKSLQEKRSLLFNPVRFEEYQEAKEAFLGYPFSKVGDVSAQGDILRWLYLALKENQDITEKDYENLVFQKIQPGGEYVGYVESYGRILIYNKIASYQKLDVSKVIQNDDQMVGFMPYIAVKALNLPTEKAYALAQAFTNRPIYLEYFNWLDTFVENLANHSLKETLEILITKAPSHQDRFEKAITLDPYTFTKDIVNTACHIDHAIPLVMNILFHTNDLKEALKLNVVLGGASSDRASIIGFIYSYISELPKEFTSVHP
jgi:hypothetical protein